MANREILRITKTDCRERARAFRKVASPTRYNNTVAGLRHVFEVAKRRRDYLWQRGGKAGVPVCPRQLMLPSGDQFLQLVDVVEHAGAWCSQDCADFVRGLAFTGLRKGEAGEVEWRE